MENRIICGACNQVANVRYDFNSITPKCSVCNALLNFVGFKEICSATTNPAGGKNSLPSGEGYPPTGIQGAPEGAWKEFDSDTGDFVTEQITSLIRDKGSFTSDDITVGQKNRLVIGAVINSLARKGIIKKDGHVYSNRPETHNREICRWVKGNGQN